MKTLVIYDSLFGNTEKVAKVVSAAANGKVKYVLKVTPSDLNDLDLLVVGAPTHGGQPSEQMLNFLNDIPSGSLVGVKVAAFDTRISVQEQKGFLKALIRLIDFASPKMAKVLVRKGGVLVAEAEGFVVTGKKGPLKKGELQRAKTWAKELLKRL